MPALDIIAREKLADLDARTIRRTLSPTTRLEGGYVERDGRRLLSFSCNDYLGLTHHPAVVEAAIQATRDYGTGAGASRLVTGDHPLVEELETRLAAFKGAEAACVFSSGYMANVGAIPTFVGEGDVIFIDERAHGSLWAGAKASGAEVIAYPHNDPAQLEPLIAAQRAHGRHALIVTEGVFSMDGDLAPLDALSEIAARHDAWLMVDDAHGLGVTGPGGRGTASLFPAARIDLAMGTLSKALGSQGGYVAGSRAAIDLLKTRARTLVYSTGLAPACAAAALAALDIIEADPGITAKPIENARRFARALNLPEPQSAIIPIILGEPCAALAAQAALEEEGFLVAAIRPPTVAAGTSRLRIAFTATLPKGEIDKLAQAVRRL